MPSVTASCLTEAMRLSALVPGTLVVTAFTIAGCGAATPRSSERFCGELTAHLDEINTGPPTADDIPAFITLFSKMGEVAPLDVQRDWEQIYASLKTANTVDVEDPASVQAVADSAYETQRSAENVAAWAMTNCGLDLGPVGAAGGGAEVIVTTTTVIDTTVSGG